MLTVPEAARRVGRNPETVRRWIRDGKLRANKVGTQHVIEEHDLDGLLEGRGQPSLTVRTGRAPRVGEVAAPYWSSPAGPGEIPIVDPWLPAIVGRIVRLVDPLQVILFGSRARGDSRIDSDYDLLIVLDEVVDRRSTRIALRRVLDGLPISKDVVVASRAEIEEHNGPTWGIRAWALREGRTVYERS